MQALAARCGSSGGEVYEQLSFGIGVNGVSLGSGGTKRVQTFGQKPGETCNMTKRSHRSYSGRIGGEIGGEGGAGRFPVRMYYDMAIIRGEEDEVAALFSLKEGESIIKINKNKKKSVQFPRTSSVVGIAGHRGSDEEFWLCTMYECACVCVCMRID